MNFHIVQLIYFVTDFCFANASVLNILSSYILPFHTFLFCFFDCSRCFFCLILLQLYVERVTCLISCIYLISPFVSRCFYPFMHLCTSCFL